MLSYKDMTYCIDADHCNNKNCHRRLIEEDIQEAQKIGLWIAHSSFMLSCKVYEPVDKY